VKTQTIYVDSQGTEWNVAHMSESSLISALRAEEDASEREWRAERRYLEATAGLCGSSMQAAEDQLTHLSEVGPDHSAAWHAIHDEQLRRERVMMKVCNRIAGCSTQTRRTTLAHRAQRDRRHRQRRRDLLAFGRELSDDDRTQLATIRHAEAVAYRETSRRLAQEARERHPDYIPF